MLKQKIKRLEISLTLLTRIEAAERTLKLLENPALRSKDARSLVDQLNERLCVETRSAYATWQDISESRGARTNPHERNAMIELLSASLEKLRGSKFEKAIEERHSELVAAK